MEIKFPLRQISLETNHLDKWKSKCIEIRSDSVKVDNFIA